MIKITKNERENKSIISTGLFIIGGVVLICSVLFSIYTVYIYISEFSKITWFGALLASLVLLFGSFVSFTAFGVSRIIEQNDELLRKGDDNRDNKQI